MTNNHGKTLLTDLYQITMAYGYWKHGRQDDDSVFHLFFRKAPFGGAYAIAAGLEPVLDYLEGWGFTQDDVDYLAGLQGNDGKALFEAEFLEYLLNLKLTVRVDAMPEGTVAFPHEPLVRIQGPVLQCQLLETPLLNIINFNTLIATKAARICQAADNDQVLEFGLRRAQGVDGAMTASRAAFIGGVAATSNVLAGKQFNIPIKGTHAHSWVMSYEEELEAFEAYAEAMPNNAVLLVDTYDTLEGVKKAIQVGQRLDEKGYRLAGIRLDSGDLAALSKAARQLLDDAGLTDALIVASNDLDEYAITELKANGAAIDVWGVGTKLATAYDQPALGGVYKLGAIKQDGNWQYRIKLSNDLIKVSNPGVQQVYRLIEDDRMVAAGIGPEGLNITQQTKWVTLDGEEQFFDLSADITPVLQPAFDQGERVYPEETLADMQQRTAENLAMLGTPQKRLTGATPMYQGLELSLFKVKKALIEAAEGVGA